MHKISSRQFSSFSVPMNSKGRMFKEKKSFFRNPYQRDRDRIIHSTAFRRLKHKTQVFVNTSSDHFRTRITHSMEVAQIARTLAKNFNLRGIPTSILFNKEGLEFARIMGSIDFMDESFTGWLQNYN